MRGSILLALILVPGLAAADVLHLKNGRTLEGKVVSERGEAIGLEVQGGVLRVPRSSVARVERRAPPEEEYRARLKKTDLDDPAAVEALSLWASAHGLGAQAKDLRRIANGQRLQQRVAVARKQKDAGAFFLTYRWAQRNGFGDDVLRYLLEQALDLDPRHGLAQKELRRLPAVSDDDEGPEEEARREPEREEPARSSRETELERRLAEQQSEADALRKRLAELERRQEAQTRQDRLERRRLRRARQSGNGGMWLGPYRLDGGPTGIETPGFLPGTPGSCPKAPAPAPAPAPRRVTTATIR
ncbi:MAG: hypothetical protein AB7N76_21980 [Planctomycetota bacterium]